MQFDHGAFQVSNMDEAIAFYTDKLGFELNFRDINQEEQEAYAFLQLGNARIELIQDLVHPFTKPEIKKPYCPHFCIEIEDMQVALDGLKEKGVEIVRGPLEIAGEETWVYFADQDHNILEFIQWYKKK